MGNMVNVLLADDSPEFRALLKNGLEKNSALRVAGAAGDGLELIQLANRLRPDVILTDAVLSRLDGLSAARQSFSPLFPALKRPPKPRPWGPPIT